MRVVMLKKRERGGWAERGRGVLTGGGEKKEKSNYSQVAKAVYKQCQ